MSVMADILVYLLAAPGIGTLVFLAVMGLPAALWSEMPAVFLVVGFGYIVSAIPAAVTGGFAARLDRRPLWQRLLLPGFVAAGFAEVMIPLFLRADWNAASQRLRLALGLAGFAGALAAAVVLELWRRRVQIRATNTS